MKRLTILICCLCIIFVIGGCTEKSQDNIDLVSIDKVSHMKLELPQRLMDTNAVQYRSYILDKDENENFSGFEDGYYYESGPSYYFYSDNKYMSLTAIANYDFTMNINEICEDDNTQVFLDNLQVNGYKNFIMDKDPVKYDQTLSGSEKIVIDVSYEFTGYFGLKEGVLEETEVDDDSDYDYDESDDEDEFDDDEDYDYDYERNNDKIDFEKYITDIPMTGKIVIFKKNGTKYLCVFGSIDTESIEQSYVLNDSLEEEDILDKRITDGEMDRMAEYIDYSDSSSSILTNLFSGDTNVINKIPNSNITLEVQNVNYKENNSIDNILETGATFNVCDSKGIDNTNFLSTSYYIGELSDEDTLQDDRYLIGALNNKGEANEKNILVSFSYITKDDMNSDVKSPKYIQYFKELFDENYKTTEKACTRSGFSYIDSYNVDKIKRAEKIQYNGIEWQRYNIVYKNSECNFHYSVYTTVVDNSMIMVTTLINNSQTYFNLDEFDRLLFTNIKINQGK